MFVFRMYQIRMGIYPYVKLRRTLLHPYGSEALLDMIFVPVEKLLIEKGGKKRNELIDIQNDSICFLINLRPDAIGCVQDIYFP
jgi:hypothetical protein